MSMISVRTILTSLVFGAVALAVVGAGLLRPIPGTGVVTDPREVFTTIGGLAEIGWTSGPSGLSAEWRMQHSSAGMGAALVRSLGPAQDPPSSLVHSARGPDPLECRPRPLREIGHAW